MHEAHLALDILCAIVFVLGMALMLFAPSKAQSRTNGDKANVQSIAGFIVCGLAVIGYFLIHG